jgi:hypothetical protein
MWDRWGRLRPLPKKRIGRVSGALVKFVRAVLLTKAKIK